MSTIESSRPEEHPFYIAFHSKLAQEVLRLHFAQQVAAGVPETYAIALLEFFDRTVEQATGYTYEQILGSEFPFLLVSDVCSLSGKVVDLGLKKVDPTTGIGVQDSWVSVVGSFDDEGNPTEIYLPWSDEQAALLNQQAKDLELVDLDPVSLYTETWYGWVGGQ